MKRMQAGQARQRRRFFGSAGADRVAGHAAPLRDIIFVQLDAAVDDHFEEHGLARR